MKLSLESRHPATDCRLIIDDDGRVACAYLLDPEGVIVGDVWLYNSAGGALAYLVLASDSSHFYENFEKG